jgi:glycosyltransferase involved in cell wall biosynthesis
VSVYNIEEWLLRCLLSIKKNSFRNFECILVDDCSTDGSGDICDEVASEDGRFSVIHKSKNEGLPQSRKTGLLKAVGDYVWFVDGDDWIEEDSLEVLFSHIVSNHYPDCVALSVWSYSENFSNCSKNDIIESWILNGPYVVWGRVVKRDVLLKIDFPIVSYCEDHYITVQVGYYSNSFSFLNRRLYRYVVYRRGSLSACPDMPIIGMRNVLASIRFIKRNFSFISKDFLRGYFLSFRESGNFLFLITIIVPVCNCKKYLNKSLLSIRKQTFIRFRCILVDDCSTDGSGDICDQVASEDGRFSVIHFGKHWGTGYAREAGVFQADTPWICFVDADDMIAPTFLEEMLLASVGSYKGVIMCMVGTKSHYYARESFFPEPMNAISYLKGILHGALCYPIWGKLIRAHLLHNLVYPSNVYDEDRVILCQILKKLPLLQKVDRMLYYYSDDNDMSVSRNPELSIVRKQGESVNRKLVHDLLLAEAVDLDIPISYGCNLNCAGCNHFSSLYSEADSFEDVKAVEKYIKHFSGLGASIGVTWNVIGGEPLLHSDLVSILSLIRKYFSGPIRLWTNGILLHGMNEDFWDVLSVCDITLLVTKYPKVDLAVLSHHSEVRYYCLNRDYFDMIRLSRNCGDGSLNFSNCSCRHLTVTKNRVYKCVVAPHIENFNAYFNENITVSEDSYIPLADVVSWKQLREFGNQSCSLCAYCGKKTKSEWGKSEKRKSEWMIG